jgi:hypothetical protein
MPAAEHPSSEHPSLKAQLGLEPSVHLARWVLTSFLATFICARCLVLLIMSRRVPDLFVYVGGTHVHHLNFGIFLLAGVGALLIFRPPSPERLLSVAVLYGVGLALTFDEFGMWLHLGGGYWQRASLDAVAIIAGLLALVCVAPRLSQFRPGHWWTLAGLAVGVAVFVILLMNVIGHVGHKVGPALKALERMGPS